MKIRIPKPSEVFNLIYKDKLWNNNKRLKICFGGSSSGKSKYLADEKVLNTFRGRNTLIARKVARTLRGSVFKELKDSVRRLKLSEFFKINESNLEITNIITGKQLVCVGLDDVEKVKSIRPDQGIWNDVWVEEATEIVENDYRQLRLRQRGKSSLPKRFDLSFNPILKTHWIFELFFKSIGWADGQVEFTNDEMYILKSTYKDNKFLEQDEIKDLNDLKNTAPYYYEVYALGNWGVLGDVIFNNFRVEEFDDDFDSYKYGLDWGFAKDPFAVAKLHYNNDKLYIIDEIYQAGLVNDEAIERIKEFEEDGYYIADSSEPKSIEEFQRGGIAIDGAKKGKGSIESGIKFLQNLEIIIHPRCINAIHEFSSYQYAKDKHGNVLPKPVDKDNHLIDAIRYALEDVSNIPDVFFV